jgi:threonine dehydratase
MSLKNKPTGWGGSAAAPAKLAEIHAASKRLESIIVRTPLIPLHSYSKTYDIFLKPEVLQPIGSYKIRGVYNWAVCLSPKERDRGFSTISAGNTAMALGYIACLLGVTARSLLPDNVHSAKLEAIKCYGIEPILIPMSELFSYIFEAGWEHEPYNFLHPWVDPKMIAGSGTIGLEIIQDMPDVDTVYVPVGGGGLIGGIGSALKDLKPNLRAIAVEPEACPPLKASFELNRPTWVDSRPTICDGTAEPFIVDEMYPLLKHVVDDTTLVSEEAIKSAMKRLALRNKLLVEGSGALSVAAALSIPSEERGKAVCILSGGSIDIRLLKNIIKKDN